MNDSIWLPLMVPVIPEITNTGAFELLPNMLATPVENSEGGELINETVEFGGHENPGPRRVMVQDETLTALNVKNSKTLSRAPETCAKGVERMARLTSEHVVVNVY